MSARLHTIGRLPAVKALLLQAMAALLLGIMLWAASYLLPQVSITLGIVLVMQGVIAALLSRWVNMAAWWWFIQLCFPPALFFALNQQWPSWIFLAAFLLLLVLYWHTFRTQVPYYPSSVATWRAVSSLLPVDRPLRLVDIGSGLGGLVLDLAAKRPDSDIMGVELAPLPWLISWLRGRWRKSAGQFIRADYADLNFQQFDVIFAYLSPAVMTAVWNKAQAEMRPGSLLLSNEFMIEQQAADLIVQTERMRAPLYAWYIKSLPV